MEPRGVLSRGVDRYVALDGKARNVYLETIAIQVIFFPEERLMISQRAGPLEFRVKYGPGMLSFTWLI